MQLGAGSGCLMWVHWGLRCLYWHLWQSAAVHVADWLLHSVPCCLCAWSAGRIIDHVRNSQGFGLEDLAVLVLDEADRLLEMGFKEEVGVFGGVAREGGGGG